MKINQVNFTYVPLEDRLLFRFNTQDRVEFRMWLTRAKGFGLLDLLSQSVKLNLQQQPQHDLAQPVMQAVMEFQRDVVLAEADFKTAFSDKAASFPLGEQPILVSDVALDSSAADPLLNFRLVSGQVVGLSLNQEIGIAIGKLLSDALGRTDWGADAVPKMAVYNLDPCSAAVLH
ncbi:MAG: hypothetical protein Q7J38_09600 [Gallionella sp.]|nr:hypothetical protein [Gallionella sp.]